MPNRPIVLAAGLLVALALGGCGGKSTDNANVRVLNLISGTTNVTVTAGGATLMTGGGFESIGAYTGIGGGNIEFKVTIPGTPGALVDVFYGLGGGVYYTFVPVGSPGAATAVLVADGYPNPGSGNMAVRVLNMSSVVTSMDLYLTAPDTDIASATPVVTSATTGTVTNFVNTPAGTLRVRLAVAGTKEVIYDVTPAAFGVQTGQTIVAYGKGSGRLVNAAFMLSQTTGSIVNSGLARLKVANATSVPAPLNVSVDGTPTFESLAYPTIAPYQTVASGARKITVESSATPGATLLALAPTLAGASDTSIALAGPAGAMTGSVFTDSNQTVAAGRAQLRVVNASPAFAAIDVYANFGKIVSGVAPGGASAYALLDAVSAGTSYTFDIYPAGTTTLALSVPGQALVAGGIYTLYLMGSGGTLAGVLAQDR
jgi:hypothetical protein